MVISVAITLRLPAQNMRSYERGYNTAVGIRVSPAIENSYDLVTGSFKTFISRRGAIELNAGVGKFPGLSHWKGGDYDYPDFFHFTGSLSYQLHIPMVKGLGFIIGGTAIVQYLGNNETIQHYEAEGLDYGGLNLGVGPVGGFDYKFSKIPLNLTLDHRPAILGINKRKATGGQLMNIALAARYAF